MNPAAAPFSVVIPARLQSTRLPGKVLLDLGGKPMLQHTYERAIESDARDVIIATDDEAVVAAAKAFGANVMMTSAHHESGTERIAELADLLGLPDDAIVVNVQADEPLLPPENVDQVASNLAAHPTASMSTLCEPMTSLAEIFDPNAVKVVADDQGYALYFSRAPIPWVRSEFSWPLPELTSSTRLPPTDDGTALHFRHIGIYAYRAEFIRHYVAQATSVLERAERLEQLRALAMGAKIHVDVAQRPPGPGIDTKEDLESARRILAARGSVDADEC
jgi:3-deoxy-manno-octulosonate cytidylyltransferase (CMP-KDO synthetase)